MQKEFAIDIGTNSIRLLYAVWEDGKLKTVQKLVNTVRTGEGVNASGVLCEAAILRTLEGISGFLKKAKAWGAEQVPAFATSAVRDASNGEAFVRRVWQELGVRVQILQGKQEALCGITGALCAKTEGGILDIGGGSTEVAVLRKGVLDIPLLFLLDGLLPLYGCMMVQPIVDAVSLVAAVVFYLRINRAAQAESGAAS